MFLPALKVTVSPGLTFSEVVPFVVPPLFKEVTFQPELLIACVTLSVVAMPFVVGATALPSALVIFLATLAVIFTPFASADVEIKVSVSPLIFNV